MRPRRAPASPPSRLNTRGLIWSKVVILFHRFTPFVILALSGSGFAMLISNPFGLWLPAILCFVLIPVLFGRLLLWEFRRPAFWIFLATPCFLLVSALMFFLLLEAETGLWIL